MEKGDYIFCKYIHTHIHISVNHNGEEERILFREKQVIVRRRDCQGNEKNDPRNEIHSRSINDGRSNGIQINKEKEESNESRY